MFVSISFTGLYEIVNGLVNIKTSSILNNKRYLAKGNEFLICVIVESFKLGNSTDVSSIFNLVTV